MTQITNSYELWFNTISNKVILYISSIKEQT